MGLGVVAIADPPTAIRLKVPFSDGLGGGIGFAVTSSFTYRYRAFRRCQTMAQAEGFVRFRPPDADVLAHCQ